jgi:hypothetical protein
MKYFNILLIIGVLLGGVVGSVVEVPSYAAGSIISFYDGEVPHYYFPSTGYVVANNCYYFSSTIGKYVLPKNLSLSSLKSSRKKYPGVIMNMVGKNPASYKSEIWTKRWDTIEMSSSFNNWSTKSSVSGLVNFINNHKFDYIYYKAKLTYNKKNTTYKNQELIWTKNAKDSLQNCSN